MTNRTSIVQRRKKEKQQKINSDFLFQPKVSDGSNKIAAKLKIGFWERQKIHMQHQKQMVCTDILASFLLPCKLFLLCEALRNTRNKV